MGLFDNATPYEKIKDEENNGSNLKYLHQGVFPMTFVGAELREATNGNIALVMKYDSGFQTNNGDPNILWKTYYLLDKNTIGTEKPLISEQSWLNLRKMLYVLFEVKLEDVSTIREVHETSKLKGLPSRIEKFLLEDRAASQRQIAGTVDYPQNPSKRATDTSPAKWYLELEWVNPIDKIEEVQARFKPKANPNGPTGTDQQSSNIASAKPFDDQDSDLPF